MASEIVQLEDAPSSFKSEAWQHFGFPMTINENGESIIDKTKSIQILQ